LNILRKKHIEIKKYHKKNYLKPKMFGVVIVVKQDVKSVIVSVLLEVKHVRLNVIAIIVKMERMKTFIMKLEDKMNNLNSKEDLDLRDCVIFDFVSYIT
jgi:hypothetical protein